MSLIERGQRRNRTADTRISGRECVKALSKNGFVQRRCNLLMPSIDFVKEKSYILQFFLYFIVNS